MKVLIGCERFGRVRQAFRDAGHEAFSCDLVPTEDGSQFHIRGDVLKIAAQEMWDLGIFFPDCTYLCSSGLHWNTRRPGRAIKTEEALNFVRELLNLSILRIALENPVGCISTRIRKPDQIIHPWQFGEDAAKATCLWLKNLPPLRPTNILSGGRRALRANQTPSGQNKLGPGPDRAMERAKTYWGIAYAMAEQWGQAERRKEEQ